MINCVTDAKSYLALASESIVVLSSIKLPNTHPDVFPTEQFFLNTCI